MKLGTIGNNSWYKNLFLLLILDIAVTATVFSVSGFYNTKVDAEVYVSQIETYRQASPSFNNDQRAFKPFYGLVGSLFPHDLSPYSIVLVINLFFLLGLTVAAYFFLLQLSFDERFALWGTAWIVTGYPLLKYGLAISTDISGWFFSLVTIVAVLYGVRNKNLSYLILASLIGFIGSLSKETGALGLIFGAIYILTRIWPWDYKSVIKNLLALCLPFWILEGAFLIVMKNVGSTNFIEWFEFGWSSYGSTFYNLFYFTGVELATFSLLLPLALIGLWHLFKSRPEDRVEKLCLIFSLFIAATPIFLWPIFVSRILYSQFLFVVPLALYGVQAIKPKLQEYFLILPVVFSFVLYFVAGDGSLFSLLG